jgi:hypothetical protein
MAKAPCGWSLVWQHDKVGKTKTLVRYKKLDNLNRGVNLFLICKNIQQTFQGTFNIKLSQQYKTWIFFSSILSCQCGYIAQVWNKIGG